MAHVEGGVLTIVIRAADVVAPRPDPAVESIAIITIYQLSHPSGIESRDADRVDCVRGQEHFSQETALLIDATCTSGD